MSDPLGRIATNRKTGSEPFHCDGASLGFDVTSFWQWIASDLLSNATRGLVAEYIVARALGLASDGVRDEWATFDLLTPTGVRVEVKSTAYLQSWRQSRLTNIQFVIPKKNLSASEPNHLPSVAKRHADLYVFAILVHTDKATVDPLNVAQWFFYVVPTAALDARTRSQHSIGLNSLQSLCPEGVGFSDLGRKIEEVGLQGVPELTPPAVARHE